MSVAIKAKLTLEKAAAKSGGDKYTGEIKGETISVYFPQVVSRESGSPALFLEVSVVVGPSK